MTKVKYQNLWGTAKALEREIDSHNCIGFLKRWKFSDLSVHLKKLEESYLNPGIGCFSVP